MSRNLVHRILSALVLIPIVFGAMIAGGWLFGIFVALAYGLSVGEWFEMSKRIDRKGVYFIFGTLYLSLSFMLFTELRVLDGNGLYLVLTLLMVVWASDTVAYIFGRVFAGPKMAPTISPNKTWSGMAGSLLGAAAVFTLLVQFAPSLTGLVPNTLAAEMGSLQLALCGALMGFVGQVGDLLESKMKRKADMKDSGCLIPGHGGVLDRIDALLLVIPVFVAVCRYGL